MGLPFHPEPFDMLKMRFIGAMEPVYEVDRILAGEARPGTQRKHVFDFDDGMRMVVSRERAGDEVVLHVSVSFTGDAVVGRELICSVIDKVNTLRGMTVPGLVKAFQTSQGVVHFMFPESRNTGMVMPPMPQYN